MTEEGAGITYEMLLKARERLKEATLNPQPQCGCPDCTVVGGDGKTRVKGPIVRLFDQWGKEVKSS